MAVTRKDRSDHKTESLGSSLERMITAEILLTLAFQPSLCSYSRTERYKGVLYRVRQKWQDLAGREPTLER